MNSKTNDDGGRQLRGCNVSSTFNLLVGVTAIVAALLIGYVAYAYWWA
jgi:hypothetical protein